jgi:murein DD-endopeptidase MepM/ murein hydrolase activator NlpD
VFPGGTGSLRTSRQQAERAGRVPNQEADDLRLVSSRVFLRVVIATLALAGVIMAVPAHANTKDDLDAAREELQSKQAELDALTLQWQQTESAYAEAQDAVAQAQAQIGSLQAQLVRVQQQLDAQVREVYISGTNDTIGALLGSESFADFADRLRFATSMIQGDEDLAVSVSVQTVRLHRERERLTQEAEAQAKAAALLESQRTSLASKLGDVQATVSELEQRFKDEQAQQQIGLPPGSSGGSFPISGSGAISTCPVAGTVSFVDSFGWPRPGGRIHEGIDMIAAYGTPIVAVHSGNAVQTPNELGGNAVIVYHDGGSDFTYYAHLSSYGATGHVGAGEVIGYVGSTGDTSVNHLHFEYHPGGGSAVDPYQLLLAVC